MIAKVNQLPQMTRRMIRILPSFVSIDAISEEKLMSTFIIYNSFRGTIKDFCGLIKKNANAIGGVKGKLLLDELQLQLDIIQHGYEGIFPSDYAANKTLESLKLSNYQPKQL